MTDPAPDRGAVSASVIIPTHNRRALLRQALDALSVQSSPASDFEVVVVADGCVDDTASMLATYAPPYRLTIVQQPASGAAQARNAGAQAAAGSILIFLDDDVEPSPEFVAAHLAAQAAAPGAVVLGPYPPAPIASPSLFRQLLRAWWTEQFAALAEPGHRFTYRDLLTGNMSLAADLWRRMGGLDPRFRTAGREDYEFGVRLLKANVPFVFAPEAMGWHHEHKTTTLEGSFRRAYEEGHKDALMGELHLEIRRCLPLAQPRSRGAWLFGWTVFLTRRRADALATAAATLIPALDRAGARNLFRVLYTKLRGYWYLRGVSEHFRSFGEWRSYVKQAADPPGLVEARLDLREGLSAAEAELDRLRPDKLELHFGPRVIARIGFEPGAEPWRGRHLRALLSKELRGPFLRPLALEGEIVAADRTPQEETRTEEARQNQSGMRDDDAAPVERLGHDAAHAGSR